LIDKIKIMIKIPNSGLPLQSVSQPKAPSLAPTIFPQLPLEVPPTDAVNLSSIPAPIQKPLKQATGDMALMLESMEAAEERQKAVGNDLEKQIQADLAATGRVIHAPMAVLDYGAAPEVAYSQNIDGFLANVMAAEAEKNQAKQHAPTQESHGLLGGHLGIEGGEHLAHELVSAKAHVVQAVHSSTDAVDVVVTGGQHAVKVHGTTTAHPVEEVAEHGSQVAGHATTGFMAGLTGALAAGSGILGGVMLAVGIKDIKAGLKHQDAEHTIEGANNVIVGTRSLAAGAGMAGHLIHGSEVVTAIAGVAKSTLTPLGVIHGAIDAGLGAHQVVKGIKTKDSAKITKGTLGVGLGVSLIAAAVGGGIPAIAAAGVFLGGKIIHGIRQRRSANHQSQVSFDSQE